MSISLLHVASALLAAYVFYELIQHVSGYLVRGAFLVTLATTNSSKERQQLWSATWMSAASGAHEEVAAGDRQDKGSMGIQLRRSTTGLPMLDRKGL
jgi:hypothetical protein